MTDSNVRTVFTRRARTVGDSVHTTFGRGTSTEPRLFVVEPWAVSSVLLIYLVEIIDYCLYYSVVFFLVFFHVLP